MGLIKAYKPYDIAKALYRVFEPHFNKYPDAANNPVELWDMAHDLGLLADTEYINEEAEHHFYAICITGRNDTPQEYYIGICGEEKGAIVYEPDFMEYITQRTTEAERSKALIAWFFSGNWIKGGNENEQPI